jgi:hypothetical protein
MRPLIVEISPGDFIDRMTILEIKVARFTDPEKKNHVEREYLPLRSIFEVEFNRDETLKTLIDDLRSINQQLWTVEDDLRDCERAQNFDARFVTLARSVYRLNDMRAGIKRQINVLLDAELIEEKSYGAPKSV